MVLILGWVASPASATWSIVAVDSETGEVGVAIASCVPAEILGSLNQPLVPVVLVPNVGAAVSQAQLNIDAPPRIRELMATGESPEDIVSELLTAEFDSISELRQHALVSLNGEVAAVTGSENEPVALDRQGPEVSVQGNLLASEAVVTQSLEAFTEAKGDGKSLSASLVAGLEAGSLEGGDSRCSETSALFAHLVVAAPTDDPQTPSTLLTVFVNPGDRLNPVIELGDQFRQGNRGVIDASSGTQSADTLVRGVALALSVIGIGVGVWAFRRGMGHTPGPRRSRTSGE